MSIPKWNARDVPEMRGSLKYPRTGCGRSKGFNGHGYTGPSITGSRGSFPSPELGRLPERVVAERSPCCGAVCDQPQHRHLGLDPVGGVVAARQELRDLLGREPARERGQQLDRVV